MFNRRLDTHSLLSSVAALNKLPKEIRNKCRQDPTVPKNVLIEIARKKQKQGMVTQWDNNALAKEQKMFLVCEVVLNPICHVKMGLSPGELFISKGHCH